MLERYLLSTLASKFGHVFEDFDEHTKAELSAWRGVLALRNLHLRKDALKHLGVPLAGDGGEVGEDDDDDVDDVDGHGENDNVESSAEAPTTNNDNGEASDASDDDSFLSCASQIEEEENDGAQASDPLNEDFAQVRPPPANISTSSSQKKSGPAPTIEIVHGSIGSLELHIPWRLLRATKAAAEKSYGSSDNKTLGEESMGEMDDSLRCSAVLSDVQILLAPSNHSRNQSKFGKGSSSMNQKHYPPNEGDAEHSIKRKRKEVERMRKERELAVQSLLERELFRLVRGIQGDGTENGNATNNGPIDNVEGATDSNSGNNDATKSGSNNEEATQESWLARWAKGLVARILSSLQVTVQNIHVRYEDEGYGWFEEGTERQKRRRYRPAFAVGMRLGNFSVRSANADEEMPAGSSDAKGAYSILNTAQLRRKIANVEKLSVYWDSSHSDLFVGYPTQEDDRVYYEKRFEELNIMSSDDFEEDGALHHSYLIQPISPSLQLVVIDPEDAMADATISELELPVSKEVNPDSSAENSVAAPSIHASLSFPSCHVNFDRNTLEDVAYVRKCLSSFKSRILSSKELVTEHRISQQLLDLRPPEGIRPGDEPRIWWKYAIGAVRALQSDRKYFEGKTDVKERRRRRDGWLGLARLLRLRNEYGALYRSLWSSPQNDRERKRKIHGELLALEDLLNNGEIASFRIAVFGKLSELRTPELCAKDSAPQDADPDSSNLQNEDIKSSESLDVDELALGSLSVVSLEYREMKLNQILRSIDPGQNQFHATQPNAIGNDVQDANKQSMEGKKEAAPMWVVSIACQDFTLQANDTPHINDALHIITAQSERQKIIPIARLQCLYSLKFERFCNGSWDLSCALNSLTVSDLISPYIGKSAQGQTLIGRKRDSLVSEENMNTGHSNEHTASIVIRNVVSDENMQATTHFKVNVSPLEVIYSTNAFEALSRLFAAVKTDEFNRDYERITRALSRWRLRQKKRLVSVLARCRKKFVVSISIAAPVLFIPEDLQHADSPTLVVDLGRLTLQNDSNEAPPFGFDDKWLLQIDSIKALCIQQKSTAAREHAIIEPFSLKFSILTHIAEGESSTADSTKIDIQALLPQLCFNFTSSAVRLVSRLQIRFHFARKYAKLRNPQTSRRQTLDEFLLANRGLSRHHAILRDFAKDEHTSQDDVRKDVVVTKQEIKFLFSAPTIALQIGNDVEFEKSSTSLIPLINLSIRGIRGNFLSRNTDAGSSSQFSARLRSIHAKDIQQAGSQFCHFLSSMDPDLLEECVSTHDTVVDSFNDEDDDLVVVEMSKQSNGDQEISIHFHELYVEWNPELLARIQKSLRLPPSQISNSTESSMSSDENTTNQTSNEAEFFDALDDNDTYIANESEGTVPHVTKDIGNQPPSATKKPSPQFQILFHLSKLRVNFNKDSQSRCLFTAEMNQTDIAFRQKTLGGTITTATVANARLKDPDGTTGGTLYGQMIGLQSGGFTSSSAQTSSIVNMSFESFTNCDEPEFHNLMKIEFSEMKFVYLHQLWLEIFDFFFEGILGHAVWGTIPKPSNHFFDPSEATRSFKRTKMSIEMVQPLILLPLGYRSPQHIRLKLNALKVTNDFSREQMKKKGGNFTEWVQWFNSAKVELLGLSVRSWDERKLNEVSEDMAPPSMTLNIRWPVGPTAPLVKPKWNVAGRLDPIVLSLSRKDFSLFRFFASYNLMEPSRFISKQEDATQGGTIERLVLFGYEKTGVPPTTYSIKLSSNSLVFKLFLDEEESENRKMERMMDVNCTNASWSMVKNVDCISKQRANVESIRLTSKKQEWGGFPNLLLPLPASTEATIMSPHCLLQFTSTTHPNGNNVKTLHLDAAGIYLIVPAWRHVGDFFTYLPTFPEVFAPEEMSSIMQVGDRFYRMSKSRGQAKNVAASDTPEVKNPAPPPQVSKHFLLTLTSPRIILVADATNQQNDSQSVTLSMAHMHFLREANSIRGEEQTEHSVFCDGLEIFTGMAQDLSPCSSLLCPLSVSGSFTKVMRSKSSLQQSGWVWVDEVEARAAYTDIVHAIGVFNGVQQQISVVTPNSKRSASKPVLSAQSIKGNNCSITNEEKRVTSENTINIEFLCDGIGLVLTDDSQRQFANAQPLVALSLAGLRCSRVVTDSGGLRENQTAQSRTSTLGLGAIENDFVSLDSLELTDLLRHGDSPFRVMATSSHTEHSKQGLFSFTSQIELAAMSWQSHKMVASDCGFQMSPSMKQRLRAIHQLTPPSSYFDRSSGRHEHLMAFQSVSYENGLNCIDFNIQNLTAQWNPSTIIAVQRFLGRLKKAAISILLKTPTNKSSANNSDTEQLYSKRPSESCHVTFSVNADIESVCICLNKEYQHRRLLDILVTGVKIEFERCEDESLLLQGSIRKIRVWDPDMSKTISERNRNLLGLTDDVNGNRQLDPFFSFQYRTFRTVHNRGNGGFSLPDWVEEKNSSADIDDFLMIKTKPLEFNYLSERTAELADYLNNGLPGKGLGHTSKAAQSFCERRIRTRSFLDLTIDQPRVFIPRSPSSLVGGCYLSLGTVSVTSWFEEGCARANGHISSDINEYRLDGTREDEESSDKMDWWRVLDINLGIGIQIEVNEPIFGGLPNPDIFFQTSLTMRKPSSGNTTIIQGRVPALNILLKYREFMMLNLIQVENMKPINSDNWENIEKSYWQNQDVSPADASSDQHESSLIYAESARFVRFGEAKAAASTGTAVRFEFVVDSISVMLHRDDWFENLDEENAALLCYDICKFSIHKMDVAMVKRSNGDKTTSIALYDMSFTDVGDYGRLARDIYLSSNDPKHPPCAFSVVAEGYGESSKDPLVALVIGTQTSYPSNAGDEDAGQERKKVIKNVDLKVNSLSITVLPRSIDDVLCFLSKQWNCPSSNLEIKGTPSSPNSPKNYAEVTAAASDTLRFKFVAIYPRLILLADESNPFSRALVLRGLAVGNMSIIREEVSSVSRYGQVDMMTTTNLSGHVKELETFVHNNIDMMIGPSPIESKNNAMGVTLIEPVTVTVEVSMESRSRFPTSRFVSMDIEPVAMSLSFGDLNLIETVMRRSTRRKGEKLRNKNGQSTPKHPQLTPMNTQVDSLQFSKSSDYSECDEGSITIDVVMLTKKLGLQLRLSGSSVIVESSLTNPNVEPGDILISINGKSVERKPLQSIVDIFESSPRPLTITLSRVRQPPSSLELEALRHQSSVANGTHAANSNSTSFDMNFSPFDSPTSENAGINAQGQGVRSNQMGNSSRRFDLTCECGKPNGLELKAGLGGAAVVNNIDYDSFSRAISGTDTLDQDNILKRLPLPGAILLAVDMEEINEKKLTFEEVSHQLKSFETSAREKSYKLSFVEADSSSWGNITNFNGKLSFGLTIIDDTNGRDMPVLRAGLKETSFIANHGLFITTKTIPARRPNLLSFDPNKGIDSSTVFTLESNISSFSLDYNNAMINAWEPIIEPHGLLASLERQSASGSQPGQCSIAINDDSGQSSSDPSDFICVNVSDSAVNILSKAHRDWRLWKSPRSQTSGENENIMSPPATPRQKTQSPVFGDNPGRHSTSSAADLKRATKLAKLALDFSRKRGKISTTDTTNSPFVFRNRTGLMLSFSARGIETTDIRDGHDAQFRMSPVNEIENSQRQNGTRFRKYDGRQFPSVDIELGFDTLGTICPMADAGCRDVHADIIANLPTDKVGRTVRSVCLWKKGPEDLLSQRITVVWAVELEENRRVLTLSSATNVTVWGCGDPVEIGVCVSNEEDENSSAEIAMIGTTSKNNMFHLPVWVESCFCEVDVFIRPSTQSMDNKWESSIHKWSTFPVLSLKEDRWNADAIEVHYDWVTELTTTLGGVSCLLSTNEEQSVFHPVWMKCTFSNDILKKNIIEDNHTGPGTTTTVTIWSAMTIRNMLPCNIEWEVASHVQQDGTCSIFDSSSKRDRQRCLHGSSFPSERSSLQCGSGVEIFTADALHSEVHARFKCVVRNVCHWSEWLNIGLARGTMRKSFGEQPHGAKQINIQCKIGSCESPLTIGVKLSSRAPNAGQGMSLTLYAEIWLRNLTSLPLTFGAPSLQVGSDGDIESSLPGKVSADSALIELSSVLEGNSFGLFSNTDDDDDDLGDDILNLPLQQCEEVFEEVFEYVSIDENGSEQRKWWASENHVRVRQEPNDNVLWMVDCAGEPFLHNGWESCANIAGSKTFNFNGRRLFNKNHRFRRRRLFRKINMEEPVLGGSISDSVIFHQPADLDRSTRSRREAERNAIGVHLDEKKEGSNILDVFNPIDAAGVLDIMSSIANDGSILIHVKHKDGKFSSPAIIPPSGSSNGVIRACSSRWPNVTKAIKEQKRKDVDATWNSDGCDPENLGIAPLEPTVFELVYQVTALSGLWGELSRMVTITPRFLIKNESSWLDIDVKQVGAPDTSRVQMKHGEMLPFYWFDLTLPELVCARPAQSRNRFKWSGGFDMCTLGMVPLRVRRIDGSINHLSLRSIRVNVELQPGTGGSGTIVSIRDEDPNGEGSLFKIENHSPFQIFVSQDGVLANPASGLLRNDTSLSCDMVQPGERTSYALDVPWRQGKYAGRTSASVSELLLLRCALAPLSTRDGVESTKVVCFSRVGDSIRLSPTRLSSVGSYLATELLGVRVVGVIGTDGPTRTLRFILMQKEVTPTGYIGNAMRDTISPMPSFMTVESAPHNDDDDDDDDRTKALLDAATNASELLNAGSLPDEREATKQAFFGTGICKRPPLEMPGKANPNLHEDNIDPGDEVSCELHMKGFLFSIIDSSPTELAVVSLHGVRVGASWNTLGKKYARSTIVVGWLQLDNHCPNSVYPVAMRPWMKTEGSWKEEGLDIKHVEKPFTADRPFLELKIDFAPRHRTGIQSLSAGASLHDVEIFLDLAFILRMQRWWLGIQDHAMGASGRSAGFIDSRESWDLPNIEHLLMRMTQTIGQQSMMYFHRLTIVPCKVRLSVAPTNCLTRHQEEFEGEDASAIHAAVRKGDLLVGEGSGVLGVKIGSKNQTAISVVQGMLKSILVDALLRCDGASLNFEGVALFNHTSNSPQLVTYLGAHYLASLIANVPSLIGSLAAFGNPLGLIRDLGDGVSDFVNEPVKGFKKSFEEMDPSFALSGVARGTGSLARHTVGGFVDSAAMLTETAAKNMAVLTLDRRYAQRRDRVMKLKANDAKAATILKGLESGIHKLVNGVLEGVTGVVSKPIRGAERSGLEGFAKGVGKGLLGLIMKPVIGTTDLLTDTLIGVKGSIEGDNSQGMLSLYSQVRPRRALYGRDRVVKPYRIDDATAATIQSKLCIGGEEYLSHVDMVKNVALMSVKRLLVLSGDGEELILLRFKDIRKVEVLPQVDKGFVIKIFLHEVKADGSYIEKVECEEEKMANLLCEKLIEAIRNTS